MPIGSFPAVLGHEGAGVIRRLGADVQGLQVGDHVLLSFASCMDCPRCHEGQKGVCAQITRINFGGARGLEESPIRLPDGRRVRGQFFGQSSFSELSIVDVRSVVKYSGDEKDLSFLAPLGCGYMTGAGTIFNELRPKAKSTIAIFGLGAVGLAAVMAAKYKAVNDIIAVDNVPAKLELALSVGAKHVIDSTKHTDIAQAIHGLYSDGVDYIMDTTGSSLLVNSGIKALGHAGTMALVGVFGPEDKLHVNALDLLTSCKSVVGIILGSADPQEVRRRLGTKQQLDIHGLAAITTTSGDGSRWILSRECNVQSLPCQRSQ